MSHRNTIHRFARRVTSTILMLALAAVVVPASASADEWLERAQRDMGLVTGNKAVEPVLFPALLGMDVLSDGDEADILSRFLFSPRGHSDRQRLIDWVNKPAQQAVLEAVRTVSDPDENYMFSLQIGRDKVDSAWAESGLYIESGYENLLFDAEYVYLDQMLVRLFVVQYANGLAKAEAGEGDEALMDYAKFIALYRLLLERPTFEEKSNAIQMIESTAMLMADLVYQYTRPGDTAFTPRGIADAILETDDAVQRFRFRDFSLPTVTEYTVRQSFDWVTQGGSNVDPRRFMALSALVGWRADGLSRYGVYAANDSLGSLQLDRIAFDRKVRDVFADYNRRWNYTDLHDPDLKKATVGDDTWVEYSIIAQNVELQYPYLFEWRLEMLTALAGMRSGLAVVAFRLENGNLPGRLVAIQPRFLRSLSNNLDHMNYNDRVQVVEPLQYWVPIRDENFGVRETPRPYVIKAVFNNVGRPASGMGIPPATRNDLGQAVMLPGFAGEAAGVASGEGEFDASNLGAMLGLDLGSFSPANAPYLLSGLIAEGKLPQFGLPEEDHAALEAYLAGDSQSLDFAALRTLIKRQIAQNPPKEQAAQQVSVGLSLMQTQGITPDNMVQRARESMEADLAEGMPSDFDPSTLGDNPFAGMLASGDPDQITRDMTGMSVNELMDYMVGIVERVASVRSFRDAVNKANQGEFMSSSEFVRLSQDMVDALVVAEVIEPIRNMLIHVRGTEFGQMMTAFAEMQSGATQATFALDENSFLLYSVGDNGRDDRAALVDDGTAGDVIFWPPHVSLYREHLNR